MTDQSQVTAEKDAPRSSQAGRPDVASQTLGTRAILVLGMHRSGTSALTRLVNLLGADLPSQIMAPGRGNEAGHWESNALRRINDRILASGRSRWDDWRAFNPAWYASAEAELFRRILLQKLQEDFSASRFFVLKDPRICRILPFWLDVLGEFGAQPNAVIPIRNPIEVAESLRVRDGMAPAKSCLLWLRHVLDAERASRALPRTIMTYDSLLDDWRDVAATIATRGAFSWPRPVESVGPEVDEFLAVRLRHHVADPRQLEADPDIVDWVKDTYATMTRLASAGDDEGLIARLDSIAAAFEKASAAFGAVLGASDVRRGRARHLAERNPDAADDDVPAASIADEEHATDDDLAEAQSALSQANSELQQMRAEYDQACIELGKARADLEEYKQEVQRFDRDIATARDELERRSADLELLNNELEIVRSLADRRRDAIARPAPSDEQQSALRSVAVYCEHALLVLWHRLRHAGSVGSQIELIRASGLFDEDWYSKRYPDVAKSGLDPLTHYVKFGAWEGRDPHALFDSDWYHTTYPDAASLGMVPLVHFIRIGASKGYYPNPLFHTDWYVAKNSDVADTQLNPLRHYIQHAAEVGRNPNPLFDSAWYLSEYPDVAATGENPLAHYIRSGISEMRDPHPLFDTEWYLDHYEHAAVSGMDALEHYLTIGAFEGYRPSAAVRRQPKQRGDKWRRSTRGEVGRLANWLAADIEPIEIEWDETDQSPSPVDTFSWEVKLGRRQPVASPFTGQIGVFVHLFYEDLADEIAAGLLAIPFDFKVYVSTNSKEKQTVIDAAFRRHGLEPVIKILPNRGWDIAPFLLGFVDEMRAHDICLKLHGKRSRFNTRLRGARWRKHLLSGLVGGPRDVAYVVDSFSSHPEVGVLMTHHWSGVGRAVNAIGANYLPMQALLRRVGLSISPDQSIEFPSGSMFWFRRAALQPLFDLGLTWSDFNECRARDRDATIAHGIERCILIFAAKAGFKWAFLPNRWRPRNWRLRSRRKPPRAPGGNARR